jgi:hypothetical protein
VFVTRKPIINDRILDCYFLSTTVSEWPAQLAKLAADQTHKGKLNLDEILNRMRQHPMNKTIKELLGSDNDHCTLKNWVIAVKNNYPFKQFSKEDVIQWVEEYKQKNKSQDQTSHNEIFELLALVNQAIRLSKGDELRETQLISVLVMLLRSKQDRNIMGEIGTGEGKTRISAAVAGVMALTGKPVNIISSSEVLAKECEQELKPILHDLLGFGGYDLSLMSITSFDKLDTNELDNKLYLIKGDQGKYQLDNKPYLIKDDQGKCKIWGYKKDRWQLTDIDSLAIDFEWKQDQKTVFISPRDGIFNALEKGHTRSACISEKVCKEKIEIFRERYQAPILFGDWKSFAMADLLTIYKGAGINKGRNAFTIIDEVDRLINELLNTLYLNRQDIDFFYLTFLIFQIYGVLKNISKAEGGFQKLDVRYIVKIISTWISEGKLNVPNNKKEFVDRRLRALVKACKQGLESKLDEHFIYEAPAADKISEDKAPEKKKTPRILPVDKTTGVTQFKTTYAFMQPFLEIEYLTRVNPITLKAVYMSVSQLIDKFLEEHGIVGMSGTLGIQAELDLMFKLFKLKGFNVPRFKQRQFTELVGQIAEDANEQADMVVKSVTQAVEVSRAALILCDTIADAKKIFSHFEDQVKNVQLHQRLYSHKISSIGTKQQPLKERDVLVSTHVSSRGTDIHLTEKVEESGGLHVVVTGASAGGPLPRRTTDQGFGRSARCGKKGSAQEILLRKAPDDDSQDNKVIYSYFDLKRKRDEEDIELLAILEQQELPKVQLESKLICLFGNLLNQVRKEFNKPQYLDNKKYITMQLDALERHWADWLDAINCKVEETPDISFDELAGKFKQFETKIFEMIKAENITKLIISPASLTKLGDHLRSHIPNSVLSKEEAEKFSVECYEKAIELEPAYAANAHLKLAFHYFEKGNHRAVYRHLKRARCIFRDRVSEMQQCLAIVETAFDSDPEKGKGMDNSSLVRSFQGHIQCYNKHISAISDIIGEELSLPLLKQYFDDNQEAFEFLDELTKQDKIKPYRLSKKVSIEWNEEVKDYIIEYKSVHKVKQVTFPENIASHKTRVCQLLKPLIGKERNKRNLRFSDFKQHLQPHDIEQRKIEQLWLLLLSEKIIKEPCLKTVDKAGKLLAYYDDENRDQYALDFFGGSSQTLGKRAAGRLRHIEHVRHSLVDLAGAFSQSDFPGNEIKDFYKLSLRHYIVLDKKRVPYFSWRVRLVLVIGIIIMVIAVATNQYWLFRIGAKSVIDAFIGYVEGSFDISSYSQNLIFDLMQGAVASDLFPAKLTKFASYKDMLENFSERFVRDYASNYQSMKLSQQISENRILENSLGKFNQKLHEFLSENAIKKLEKAIDELYQASYEEGQAENCVVKVLNETLQHFHTFACSYGAAALMKIGETVAPVLKKQISESASLQSSNGLLRIITKTALFLVSNVDKIGGYADLCLKAKTITDKASKNMLQKTKVLKNRGSHIDNECKRRTSEKDFKEFKRKQIRTFKNTVVDAASKGLTRKTVQPLVSYACNKTANCLYDKYQSHKKKMREAQMLIIEKTETEAKKSKQQEGSDLSGNQITDFSTEIGGNISENTPVFIRCGKRVQHLSFKELKQISFFQERQLTFDAYKSKFSFGRQFLH